MNISQGLTGIDDMYAVPGSTRTLEVRLTGPLVEGDLLALETVGAFAARRS